MAPKIPTSGIYNPSQFLPPKQGKDFEMMEFISVIRLCYMTKRDLTDIIRTSKSVGFELIKGELILSGPDLIRKAIKRDWAL